MAAASTSHRGHYVLGQRKKGDAGTDTKTYEKPNVVTNVHQLRHHVLTEKRMLRELSIDFKPRTNISLLDHEVVKLIAERYRSGSVPGARAPNDTHKLALSIEGGGMRGAVSAGMASAIACLGLLDCFDSIYGSSAGAVVGAYLSSRQICMDVYVDILPDARKKFVCKKRMLSNLFATAIDARWKVKWRSRLMRPGMNLDFVVDEILNHEQGMRPLDIKRLLKNERHQPLRVATSTFKDGEFKTECFGPSEEHFYDALRASMTVPGAAGSPVQFLNATYYDAFCFEPLPYRSAVEEGATHVLCLCSRPEGWQPKSQPGLYERAVAPWYFDSNGLPDVADFFRNGGQQYIYAEDILTLEDGKRHRSKKVPVPPPRALYAADNDQESASVDDWKTAYLLPLKVPVGTRELPTLEQGKTEVLEAVRGGFAAAFDMLAPAANINIPLTGMDVAERVFSADSILNGEEQLGMLNDLFQQTTSLATSEEKLLEASGAILKSIVPLDDPSRVGSGLPSPSTTSASTGALP